MQTTAVGKHTGLSFTVYGEAVIIMVQNCIITLLVWNYNKSIGTIEKLMVMAFLSSYAVLLFDPFDKNILQPEHWALITSNGIVLSKYFDLSAVFQF